MKRSHLFLAMLFACGNQDFDPQSKVDSVRILTSRATLPIAKPGDTVKLELLAVDGRINKAKPMRVAWIPLPCVNPPQDLYYLCFAQALAGGGDGGAPRGDGGAPGGVTLPPEAAALLTPGSDLTDVLPAGPELTFRVPDNAILPRPNVKDPYGLVIYFNIACAGRIRVEGIDPAKGPQQVPFYCSDEQGNRLPPSEYVVGFTRVYVYADRTNQNPTFTGITWDGQPVDVAKGIEVERCLTQGTEKDKCPEHKLDVIVPPENQELNQGELDSEGNPAKEILWATYYSTAAVFQGDLRLLYDARTGKVPDSSMRVYPSDVPQVGNLWLVVKDNRGGTAWQALPFTVK
jgi:hypothetical protein